MKSSYHRIILDFFGCTTKDEVHKCEDLWLGIVMIFFVKLPKDLGSSSVNMSVSVCVSWRGLEFDQWR